MPKAATAQRPWPAEFMEVDCNRFQGGPRELRNSFDILTDRLVPVARCSSVGYFTLGEDHAKREAGVFQT